MGAVCSCYQQTVAAGKAVAITERSGVVSVFEGPTQVCVAPCYGRTIEDLQWQVAGESEFLEVKFMDGHTELQPGPTSIIQHPVDHAYIQVKPAIPIGDQELIVVYRKQDDGIVKREIVYGPALFTPRTSSEWVHDFTWTGPANPDADSTDAPARKKVGALRFTKLKTIPGKMYFDVENVRTKDNALITVKLMIFYKLVSVETLLDNSNDPMSEFINAVSADVIQWCAPKKFDEFLEATEALNSLAPYPQLTTAAKKIGYDVGSLVFRGYSAPGALQSMHDRAIEKRTQLGLQKESEEEEQKLADYKLQKESERQMAEQKLAVERLNNEITLKKKKAEAEREVKALEQQQELERLRGINNLDKNKAWTYLVAKDCVPSPVYQSATMMVPDTNRR